MIFRRAPALDLPEGVTMKLSARAKVLRLRVDSRTGGVVLTVPKRVSQSRAIAWARSQEEWIARARSAVPATRPIEPGAVIPFRGEQVRIAWEAGHPRTPDLAEGEVRIGGPREGLDARILRWLKREALTALGDDTRLFAARAGVSVSRVGVGDTVSRWGSCSSSGAIRYSWRLILAPDWVREATAAHEVAHRIHMHHGPGFHTLVAELLGRDPAPARLWLRRNGAALHRIGR
ncbi:MAG TPA: SprT family zinc-dependent metalloprotease [Allosphingosinicella sp.]